MRSFSCYAGLVLNSGFGRGKIAAWYGRLSPEERSELARKAGKLRWKNGTDFDRIRARAQLQSYRLCRAEALRRLELARLANALRIAGKLDLSGRPHLR